MDSQAKAGRAEVSDNVSIRQRGRPASGGARHLSEITRWVVGRLTSRKKSVESVEVRPNKYCRLSSQWKGAMNTEFHGPDCEQRAKSQVAFGSETDGAQAQCDHQCRVRQQVESHSDDRGQAVWSVCDAEISRVKSKN